METKSKKTTLGYLRLHLKQRAVILYQDLDTTELSHKQSLVCRKKRTNATSSSVIAAQLTQNTNTLTNVE